MTARGAEGGCFDDVAAAAADAAVEQYLIRSPRRPRANAISMGDLEVMDAAWR